MKYLTCLMIYTFISISSTEVMGENDVDDNHWKRHVLPLPHEIEVEGEVVVPLQDVSVRLFASQVSPLTKNAKAQIENLFPDSKKIHGNGNGFKISMGIPDSSGVFAEIDLSKDIQRLKNLPNNEQAYIIRSAGEREMVIVALDGKGLFYGALTLRQLLEVKLTKSQVVIPVVTITDWPDLKERGLWNSNTDTVIPWLASMKINFEDYDKSGEMWTPLKRGEKAEIKLDLNAFKVAKENAYHLVPRITHSNFLHRYGLFRAYPELAGKGKQAFQKHNGDEGHRVPCASNPLFTQFLTESYECLAKQGIRDISVWTSEYLSNCECEQCNRLGYRCGQLELEAKAMVSALKNTRKKYPGFNIRIFYSFTQFSEGNSLADLDRFVKSVPVDVPLERACYLGRKYQQPRNDIYDFPSDEFVARGGKSISYMIPTERYNVLIVKDHIASYLRRKWIGAYSLRTYPAGVNKEIASAPIYAVAEWGWNNQGRNARQFGEAWAVKTGLKQPEKAGQWFELVAPIEYDVYGSCYAPEKNGWTSYISEEVPASRKRTHSPLGRGYYRYYESKNSFNQKYQRLEKALAIAKSIDSRKLASETKLMMSFVKQSEAGNQIVDALCDKKLSEKELSKLLSQSIQDLEQAIALRKTAINEKNECFSSESRKWFGASSKIRNADRQLTAIKSNLKVHITDF